MNFEHPYKGRESRQKLGDKVSFFPTAFVHMEASVPQMLRGRVIYVNEAHRFYVVEAECNGHNIRESFLF